MRSLSLRFTPWQRVALRGTGPIIVGPWISEMGFEVLYWLPYLAQLIHQHKLPADRLVIVTRGGAAAWYPPGCRTVELYDYVPPRDLRLVALEASQQQASIKQLQMTAWERRLLDLLAVRLGLTRYTVLHPSSLYQALDPWWRTQTMGLADAMTHLRYEPIRPVGVPIGLSLPERYVVARWYQRATWPMRPELVEWTQAVTRTLATEIPVVVLTSPAYLDDHVDFPPATGPGVHVVPLEPWRDSLAVQTAILQKATGFVGTWGGVAQLAVRLKVPTVAYYDKWQGCSYQHLVLTQFLAVQQGSAVSVGRPQDAAQIRALVPGGVLVPTPPKGSSS